MVEITETRKKLWSVRRLRAARARIRLEGLRSIDKRTAAGRALVDWKESLTAALGGSENVSPQQLAVVEEAVRSKAYLDHIDAFLLSLDSVIHKRRKKLYPIVLSRMQVAEHFMRQMDRLGFARIPKPLPAIDPTQLQKILAIEQEVHSEAESNDEPDGS